MQFEVSSEIEAEWVLDSECQKLANILKSRARSWLSHVITPFLSVIAHYTGLPYVMLLVGKASETSDSNYHFVSIYVGKSKGSMLNFAEFNPTGYS